MSGISEDERLVSSDTAEALRLHQLHNDDKNVGCFLIYCHFVIDPDVDDVFQ